MGGSPLVTARTPRYTSSHGRASGQRGLGALWSRAWAGRAGDAAFRTPLRGAGPVGSAGRRVAPALAVSLGHRSRLGGAAGSGASGALHRRRVRDAGRRLHPQRHLRPQLRRTRGAHPPASAAFRRHRGEGGRRLYGGAVGRGPRHSAAVQPVRDLAWSGLAAVGGPLPLDEAHHVLAAGLPRPHLQLRCAAGLGCGRGRHRLAGGAALCRRHRLDA